MKTTKVDDIKKLDNENRERVGTKLANPEIEEQNNSSDIEV